ncbi:hypothetical protein FRC02_004889 [Tulasnella sp. 418]|nr:hypothetical protein FRC02_004889 [Tulasnella sp. 418]
MPIFTAKGVAHSFTYVFVPISGPNTREKSIFRQFQFFIHLFCSSHDSCEACRLETVASESYRSISASVMGFLTERIQTMTVDFSISISAHRSISSFIIKGLGASTNARNSQGNISPCQKVNSNLNSSNLPDDTRDIIETVLDTSTESNSCAIASVPGSQNSQTQIPVTSNDEVARAQRAHSRNIGRVHSGNPFQPQAEAGLASLGQGSLDGDTSSSSSEFATVPQNFTTQSGPPRDFNAGLIEKHGRWSNYSQVDHSWIIARLGTDYPKSIVLGKGGFGVVIMCEERQVRRWAAIKIIDTGKRRRTLSNSDVARSLTVDPSRLLSAEREVEMLSKIRHEHVVEYLWAAHVPSTRTCFIAMELMSTSLRKERKSLTMIEKRKAIREICLALEYLHSMGIIHRDLKCENVGLIERSREHGWKWKVKLLDFGIATSFRPNAPTGIAGTPGYMPPEMFNEDQSQSDKSDVWLLGGLTYELLFGERPWESLQLEEFFDLMVDNPTAPQVSPQMLAKAFSHPEDITQFQQFWKLCMQVDPEQRASVKQLLDLPFLAI